MIRFVKGHGAPAMLESEGIVAANEAQSRKREKLGLFFGVSTGNDGACTTAGNCEGGMR